MLQSLSIAIGGIVGLMMLWIIVQQLWGKTFSEHLTDEDVMAGRTSCGNCGCTTICESRKNRLTQ